MTAPIVFDHDLIVRHLQRRQPGAEDFVTSLALYDLQDRLLAVTRRFEQALIIGPDATVLPERGETHDGVFSFERAGTALAEAVRPAGFLDVGQAVVVHLEQGRADLCTDAVTGAQILVDPHSQAHGCVLLRPAGLGDRRVWRWWRAVARGTSYGRGPESENPR